MISHPTPSRESGTPAWPVRNPRLTVGCVCPDTSLEPIEMTFRLSPRYGFLTSREAHDWFLRMMREFEEFEVETDRAGELPVPFSSDTVRQVVVE